VLGGASHRGLGPAFVRDWRAPAPGPGFPRGAGGGRGRGGVGPAGGRGGGGGGRGRPGPPAGSTPRGACSCARATSISPRLWSGRCTATATAPA